MTVLLTVLALAVLIPVVVIIGSTLWNTVIVLTGRREPVSRYREEENRARGD